MKQDQRVIKKYPNRRLYDTAISQYVTLEEIRDLIGDGVKFQVIDAKSKKDITRSILLQIIVEQEESGDPILSTDFLTRVIGFYGDAMQNFMGSYLEKSMDSFLEQQETMRKQFSAMMEQTPFNVMTEMTERNLDMWRQMQDKMMSAYQPPGNAEPEQTDKPTKGDKTPKK